MDFFDPKYRLEPIRNESLFGIVDGENESPAKTTNEDPRRLWEAVVVNEKGVELQFVAVDNNIEFGKDTGRERSMCDGMLHKMDRSWVAFVELKDKTKKDSGDAQEQLSSTIELFLMNRGLKNVRYRYAYIANRRHPDFSRGMQETKQQFYNQYKFHLCCKNTIEVK